MKFPRSNKPFHGPLDAAPFAGVFFLLLIFVALRTNLIFTPGVPIRLPQSVDVGAAVHPTLSVAVDASGQFYFDNQIISEENLRQRLAEEARQSRVPLTLVIQADQAVTYDTVTRLGLLARDAGIKDALLATRPPLPEQNNQRP